MNRTMPRRVSRMPAGHPRLLHLTPYTLGDSLMALAMLMRRWFWGIDQNGQVDADNVVWIMHWPRLRRNGLRWLWTGERDAKGREVRRRLTAREANQLVQHCRTGFVSRLRTRKYGGRRVHTAARHMERMAELNARRVTKGKPEKVWCLEVKDNPKFLLDAPWDYLLVHALATGVLMAVMTLQRTQADSHRAFVVLQHAARRGWPVAILPRASKPDDWDQNWQPLGVAVWGHWR